MALRSASNAALRPGSGLQLAVGWLRAAARHWVLGLIVLQALALRLYFLKVWRAAPPGDTFNYLFMAGDFVEGHYPVGEKRLPLFPLLVALGWAAGLDPVDWGSTLSVLASSGSVLMTYVLARSLNLSSLSGHLAAVIVSFDRFLLAESARPLSESLFTFLLVSGFVAFLRARSVRGGALFGLVAGLAALTRWEGFIAAGILLASGLAARRSRAMLAAAPLFILTVSPIFLANAVAYGNPFHLQYLRDARSGGENYIVASGVEFRQNLGRILWDQLGTQPGLARDRARKAAEILRTRNWGEGREMVRDTKHSVQLGAAGVRLGLGVLGLFVFTRTLRRWALPVVGFVVLEFLLVAWWTPLSRFLSMTAPFIALWMGSALAGLITLVDHRRRGLRLAWSGASGVLALSLVALTAAHSLQVMLDQMRQGLYQDYALFQAVRYATYRLQGPVAFADEETMARPYLEGHQPNRLLFAGGVLDEMPVEEQYAWLQKTGARYVVRSDRDPDAIPVLTDRAFVPNFRLVKRFEYERPGYQDRGPVLFWTEIYEVR